MSSDNELNTLAAQVSKVSDLGTPAQVLAIGRTRTKTSHRSLEDELKGLLASYPPKQQPPAAEQKPAAPAPATPAAPAVPLNQMSDAEIEELIEPGTAIVEQPESGQLPADVSNARAMRDRLDAIKKSVLRKGNTALIQGKIWINRSGWRVIAGAFNVSDKILSQTRTVDDKGVITWLFVVEASMPGGRAATGVGMCKSNEKGGKEEHSVFATAHTRAKSRAISDIVGAGEVSAEEIGE